MDAWLRGQKQAHMHFLTNLDQSLESLGIALTWIQFYYIILDLIVAKESMDNFIEQLNKILNKRVTLIKFSDQGHCLTNLNLYEIVNNHLRN